MCNFVPGEAIAIGPIVALRELGEGLPGTLSSPIPLVSEVGDLPTDNPFAGIGTIRIKTDPGLELYAVSRLSARLASYIDKKEAIVDLNHILPFGAATEPPEISLRFASHAERELLAIRRFLRSALPDMAKRVAVLDSGLSPDYVAHRDVKFLDYSAAGRLQPNSSMSDPLGHGTRVVAILDQILPPKVELSVGRLPTGTANLTALNVAHAFGDIVAREKPHVVNLSVCLRSDWFTCPSCKQRVRAPTFLSSFLPLIIRMGGRSTEGTVTVMAAGNTGQAPNSRWLTDDVETLLLAVAENRHGDRARYSSAPDGPSADLFSAGAFGGDDPEDDGAQGVFIDGSHGTSFAAPFISAIALLTKECCFSASKGNPTELGRYTRRTIESARHSW